MKYFKYIIASILLSYSGLMWSQQESLITQYTHNMNIINPAYAGVDNESVFSSSIRTQWTGIEDAPETQTLAFSMGLGKNVGIGLSMIRDKTFIEKQTFVGIDVSYMLKASETTDIYFGIKGGGNFYDVNTDGLQTYYLQSDPSLVSINEFNPNVGVGVLIKRQKWYASFSVPRMLNTERSKNENGIATAATDRPHMYFSTGYDFTVNKKETLFLRPSTLLRYVNGAPVSIDFNTMLSFNNKFDVGGTYRTDGAFAGIAALSLGKHLTVGFAYEMSTKSELARARNTNEFLLKFKF
jgi:type IX secretion system PorP/SprF family membrane protein